MQIFFQKNNKSDGEFLHELERVCKGLIYISETDAPFFPFAGERTEAVTAETILKQIGIDADAPIEERDFDEFFERLTTIRDWHGEPEKARAKKSLELQMLLEENLRDLKVFRIGARRLDIFAVGLDKDKRLLGVSTKAVET